MQDNNGCVLLFIPNLSRRLVFDLCRIVFMYILKQLR